MKRPSLPTLVRLAATGLVITACQSASTTDPAGSAAGRIPLPEMTAGTYKGFAGGLYPDQSNIEPPAHSAAGLARAQSLTPLDTAGKPSPDGRIVLLSVGMSNTTQEFCSASSTTTSCSSWSFMGQASTDGVVNHSTLAIVNGARGGQDAATWDSPGDTNYDSVRINRLQPLGLSEKQVQVAWVKQANAGPRDSLPSPQADAYQLEIALGNIARALKSRYPNLVLVFLSSRIYAGYATTTLNPEPFAYESGLAVKWLIEAQLRQMGGGSIDARAGTLDYRAGAAPWLGWGPYLWADGMTPRASDGLTWVRADLVSDGTHPSQ